jgi:hypothetical protein
LREDLEDFLQLRTPPLPARVAYAAVVDERYRNLMRSYDEFAVSVGSLNATLRSAGAQPLPVPPAISP